MGERLIPEEDLTREQRRSRRKRHVRARTINVKRMTKRELEIGKLLYPESTDDRPRTRGECQGGARPCPFVSCVHHLFLDVNPRTGAIKLNYPDLEPEQLTDSCALDVADAGAHTLERTAEIMNLTRERVRQMEVRVYEQIRATDMLLPHPDDFEHHFPAAADSNGFGDQVEDTESAPGKPAQTPAFQEARAALDAQILSAQSDAKRGG